MADICLQIPWNPSDVKGFLAQARAADEAGVHSLWVNEGFGHDAFSGLALLARETERVGLGTSIVNVFSRTPGALAQHFATIDQLSGGRVLVGLGTSAPGVIERYHGVPFERPLVRLKETVELLRLFWRRERFSYEGEAFRLERSLPMGVEPVQEAPPILLATMAPRSVAVTGAIADGWLPTWIPLDQLPREVRRVREVAEAAGRDPRSFRVRSPGTTFVVLDPARLDQVRRDRKQVTAFFVARNGDFYFNQFVRHGLGDEARAVRQAWDRGGAEEAVNAMPDEMADRFDFAGDVDACAGHLESQREAGVDLHVVSVVGGIDGAARDALRKLSAA